MAFGLAVWAGVEPYRLRVAGQIAMAQVVPAALPDAPRLAATDSARALIGAAEAQVGVVTAYDPAYVVLDYPGGDVPPDRGVCTDVLIRALRVAYGLDLQAVLHRDMKADFAAYPDQWGLAKPDPNIDHRRVPNLRRLFERLGAEVTGDFLPGDVVTMLLPGNLTHIALVTDHSGATAPMIVHNIGAGTRVEDRLHEFEITGHYRLTPAILDRMRGLQG